MKPDVEIESQTLVSPLRQFELWVENLLKTPTITTKQKVAGALGVLGGVLSTPWTLPLTYEFGLLLSDYAAVKENNTREAIAYTTAAFSGVGTAIMFGRMTHFVLQQLAAPPNETISPISIPDYLNIKKFFMVLLWVSAGLSAIPSTYISCADFIKPMGAWALVFIVPSFGTLLARNGWGLANLFALIFASKLFMLLKEKITNCISKTDEQKNIQEMRNFFIKELRDSSNIVAQLTIDEVAQITSDIFAEQRSKLTLLDKTKKLVHLQPASRILTPKQNSFGKQLSGYLGGAVGALSTWSFFPLGKDGSNELMDYLDIHNQTIRADSALFFATSATIFVGALYIYTTLDTFEKFYEWFSKLPERAKKLFDRCERAIQNKNSQEEPQSINYKERLKLGLGVLNAIVSFAGSGPLTMMTKDNIDSEVFYAPVVIACAFIGAFSTKLWIVDNLIDEILDGKSKRKKLLNAITKMIQLLPNLRDEHIKALYTEVIENNESVNTMNPKMEVVCR